MCLAMGGGGSAAQPVPKTITEFVDVNGTVVPEGTAGAKRRSRVEAPPVSIMGDTWWSGSDSNAAGGAPGADGGSGSAAP